MIGDGPTSNPRISVSNRYIFLRLDSAGKILQTSNRTQYILGYEGEDLVGRSLGDLLPSSLRIGLRNEIASAIVEQSHLCHETFDARLGVWLEYHVCPTEDGFMLLILDVTARQREEVARKAAQSDRERQLQEQANADAQEKINLREIQENLRMALAGARMATWQFDLMSGTISFSGNLEQALGIDLESAPHSVEEALDWFVPEDFDAHRQRVEAAVTAGKEYVSEFRIRNPKTGDVRWVENRGRTQKDGHGRPIRLYGTLQDINERKFIQDELERRVAERTAELNSANRVLLEAEERLRVALKNAPISVSMTNRNLRYTWLHNPLLPDSEKYLGMTAEAFLAPDEAGQMNNVRQQVIEEGIGTRKEMSLTMGGRQVCYDILFEPLKNETGEIEGVTTVALDVTERKRSEERLTALNKTLHRRAEQLRLLTVELTKTEERERRRIAKILHDHLQQLLVGAKFSMLRLSRVTCNEATRLVLDEVSDMLDQSLAASRSLTAELVPPMLYEKGLPDALRWLVRWMQEKHGIEVTLEADDRPEELILELRVIMFEAIRELLFNVAKHAQVKRATVTLCYGGEDAVAVRVRDEGVGFDLQAQKATFGEATSGGFGLIALRERLAAIGGRLKVESGIGQGTTSTIWMPVRLEHFEPLEPPVSMESAQILANPRSTISERCRVLVADDHSIVRKGILRLLRESPGLEVIGEAEDGQKAIEMTKSLHPDVVLMDVNMPRTNGIEATRIIHHELPGVRIVGLSMYAPSEAGRAMYEAGATAFLSKDAPMEDLLAAIQQRN